DRPACSPSEPARLDRRLAGVLAAIAAAGVGDDYADLAIREAKCIGQLLADSERPLGAGPDGQAVAVPLGDRGAWFEWGVGDVGDRVACLDDHVGLGEAAVDRPSLARLGLVAASMI